MRKRDRDAIATEAGQAARQLRALDLLALLGEHEALAQLQRELGQGRGKEARRLLAEAARRMALAEPGGEQQARRLYQGRLQLLLELAVQAGDLTNARRVARDQALVQGVVLDPDREPRVELRDGFDVTQLSLEEKLELRALLDRVQDRLDRGGPGERVH